MGEQKEFHGLQIDTGSGHIVHIPFTTCWQLFNDFYETTEHACLPLIYEKSDRVLDSGAGLGYISLEIAHLADFVAGVEALPNCADVARLNTQHRPNVLIVDGALGLSDKPVTFHHRYLEYASSIYDTTIAHDPIAQSFEVPGVDINRLIGELNLNCLHLDLEGGEVDLLEGVNLSPIHKVTLETHQYVYGQDGTARIMAALFRGGLIPYLVNRPHVSLDNQDTYVMAWMRPGIVTNQREWFKGFKHRTIRFADLELKMIARPLEEK